MNFFKDLKARVEYLFVLAAFKLMGHLPYRSFRSIGRIFGTILYYIPGFGSLCCVNIHAAFPEKDAQEVRRIARGSMENLVRTICEFFWACAHPDEFEKTVDLTNCRACAEKGLRMMENGTGAILVTPHLGNWEFAGRILSQLFHYRMATVVKTARNPYLDQLISSGRSAGDVRILHSKGAARNMKKALDEGYTIGILIDQNTRPRNGGVFVNLFGIPVPVSRAPAVLARSRNRYIAIGTAIRTEGKFNAILRELPKPAAEYESDEELIQALTDITEEFIRMAPEQYLWFYRRFQYIPEEVSPEVRKRYPSYARVPSRRFFSMKAKMAQLKAMARKED